MTPAAVAFCLLAAAWFVFLARVLTSVPGTRRYLLNWLGMGTCSVASIILLVAS